jgi:hypothetical protein
MDDQRSGSSDYLLISSHGIDNMMPLKEPADKTRFLGILLKGQAMSYFEYQPRRRTLRAS